MNDDYSQAANELLERLRLRSKTPPATAQFIPQMEGMRVVINRAEHCTFILAGPAPTPIAKPKGSAK